MITMGALAMPEVKRRKRDLSTEYAVGSTSLPLGVILGIAIGGAILLFTILATIGVVYVKRKHRRAQNQSIEETEDGNVEIDLKTALHSTRPSNRDLVQRRSFNPFLPPSEQEIRDEWDKYDGLQKPALARSRSQRSFFRNSNVRDSWPLSDTPLFVPGPTGMVPNQVAPPGYMLPEPKWPERSSSMLKRKSFQDSDRTGSPTKDPHPMNIMPYRKIHRRSNSENELCTILRSTSQRLKAAQRQSMTRTLTSLGRAPGAPPSERLPTPPMRKPESCETLVDHDDVESVGSSIYDIYAQTPSGKKKHQRTSSKRSPGKQISPSSSVESKDSLCVSNTSDVVLPEPLTAPSGSRSPTRPAHKKSASKSRDISPQIHEDLDMPFAAPIQQEAKKDTKIPPSPRRISMFGDPFLSAVRGSKPIIPDAQNEGPRPVYFRKATFGQEATSVRPSSFCSPLRVVSGNVSSPPKRELPGPPATAEPNPFQWQPQEALQTRAIPISQKTTNSKRKGHKRSNVIRMSNLSRSTSIVEIVPEESEVSSIKSNAARHSSIPGCEVSKASDATKIPAAQMKTQRPPSSTTFNPTLIIPASSSWSEDDSPTLGPDSLSDTGYSPTLSVFNYYTENENESGSEDEFFKSRISRSLQRSPSVVKSRRNGRNYSADLAAFPTPRSQHLLQERFLSFPPLPADNTSAKLEPAPAAPAVLTTSPAVGLLPNITSTISGLRSSIATTAPPLLTTASHPNGPRSEPLKPSRATLSPPPRDESMLSTISMLRRMNSEVSTFSCTSLTSSTASPHLNNSPFPPRSPSTGTALDRSIVEESDKETAKSLARDRDASPEERGRSRGSQHYLNLGPSPPREDPSASARHRTSLKGSVKQARRGSSRPRLEIRDSHRIYKERRNRRTQEGAMMVDELDVVKEGSSPLSVTSMNTTPGLRNDAGRGSSSGLRFPTLSSEGSVGTTPPRPQSRLSGLRLVTADVNNSASNITVATSTIFSSEEAHLLPPPRSPERLHATLASTTDNPPRWSDAMTKPTTHSTRRESKMEHPSPVTPPKVETTNMLNGLGLAGIPLLQRDVGGRVGQGGGRPQSLGFYDAEGFLKGSPERQRMLAEKAEEERRENTARQGERRERYSASVM